MLLFILFAFVLYYFLSVSSFEGLNAKYKTRFLALSCILVAYIIGIREPMHWSDSGVYFLEFVEEVKPFSQLLPSDRPGAYSEMGFYYIGVLAKTISDDAMFYFLLVSAITMFCLYYCFKQYSIFPFIALYVYLGRFVSRNTIQIRAAIAIAIVIWGTVYVTKRKLWKYLLVVFIASRFHTSAFMALPLYFMGYVKIKKGHIYFGIAISLLIAAYFGGFIRDVVSQSSVANEWARSYIQEGSEKAWSNNLSNPMIWYQILILWLFTYYEQFFAKLSKHYYTIRNAYFYSTVLLIVLCQYGILAGRTSTVFATYECMMIPMFLLLFKKWRISGLAHIVVAVLYAGLLYYNIYRFVY